MERVGRKPKPESLTVRKAELARLLNRTTWTIDRWVREGKFPKPFRMVSDGPDEWDRRDVEAHIAKRKRSRQPKPPPRGNLKQFQNPNRV